MTRKSVKCKKIKRKWLNFTKFEGKSVKFKKMKRKVVKFENTIVNTSQKQNLIKNFIKKFYYNEENVWEKFLN